MPKLVKMDIFEYFEIGTYRHHTKTNQNKFRDSQNGYFELCEIRTYRHHVKMDISAEI